jgi:multisubunit Na+/H+ antiporter MnhB subunit
MLAMIGLIATLGGAVLTALALFGAAAVGILTAAGFGLLAVKQRRARDRWRIVLLVLQVALFAVGIPLLNAASYASDHAGTPQNPGTDGPFADGGYGLAWLTSLAFIGGAVIAVTVLLWEQILAGIRYLRVRGQTAR